MKTHIHNLFPALAAFIFMTTAGRVQAQIDLWHFDEGSGTTTADAAGSNPGTLENSPPWVSGVSSNALHFNGSSQFVVVKPGPYGDVFILCSYNGSSDLTIEAWVKWDGGGTAGFQSIYCESEYSGGDWIDLCLSNGVPYFGVIQESGSQAEPISAISPLPVGSWHHLAVVEQYGANGILYVDGYPVATNNLTWYGSFQSYDEAYGESEIGRRYMNSGDQYFSGTIDEVQLFNTARSPAQILADFRQHTVPVIPPQLNMAAAGNQSILFWPASGTNYILQSTTNLASPNWVTATDAVPVIAFTVTNSSPARYFRLQSQ